MTISRSAPASTYDKTQDDPDASVVGPILVSVAIFLAGWATSVALWGIPGLYIPALALVPVIWMLLLMISRG
ncbi:hypothetical protein SAMN05443999_104109 [Roseovarius azorensis]|uniref:Uncharacterized protein n=1 Tax=Roseovarius azorensis TaxID=1287727 RepID=A0A1H7NEB3_9RHOB|nr:hypothetical protein [Roseovarius azorensis]SEL21840.1 hypothetical protein SAMN05443999_104109 [Roseovarius azorensis]